VLRHPLVGLSGIKHNKLIEYGSGLALYSQRSMTQPKDAVNAFSGILQDLEEKYGGESFIGLPVPEFQWELLWWSQSSLKRRIRLLTWSWAGWEGVIHQICPINPFKPHQFQPHLSIWKVLKNRLIQLFKSSHDVNEDVKDLEIPFKDDPITELAQFSLQESEFDTGEYPQARSHVTFSRKVSCFNSYRSTLSENTEKREAKDTALTYAARSANLRF
jgi:hypothetical protein